MYMENKTSLASTLVARIKGAAQKERWGRAFLQIAWTAGPVTYMALQGGYLIGYGTVAPNSLFIYFAIYTVIAGIFALTVRFLYAMTRGLDHDKDRKALNRVFEFLPNRIIEIRNLQLETLDITGRRILTAKYLLEDSEYNPDSIAAAFLELTDDREISSLAREMNVIRNRGYQVNDEAAALLRRKLKPHLTRLESYSGEIIRLLERHINNPGIPNRPSRNRTTGFLERVMAAHEADNLELMSLVDVEEVCILMFELICGRRFPLIRTVYSGNRDFTDAARKLTAARREYRLSVYRRNNRLRILAENLYEPAPPEKHRNSEERQNDRTVIRRIISTLPSIRSAHLLQEKVVEILQSRVKNTQKPKELKRIIDLYERLRTENRRVERSHENLSKAWDIYNKTIRRRSQSSVKLLLPGDSGRGIRLTSGEVSLKTKQILPLSREIDTILSEFAPDHEHLEVLSNDQKELAISMLRVLERYLDLDDPIVRSSIESTRSLSFESLARAISSSSDEIAWLDRISNDRESAQRGIHEALKELISYFNLTLQRRDIDYLKEHFHADPSYLDELIPNSQREEPRPLEVPVPIPTPPPFGELKAAAQ